MTETSNPTTEKAPRELVITRVFDAPRDLVYKAWTEPEHLAQWWGPHGFTNPVCEVDVRPGGAIYIVMRGPDGTDYPMSGTFQEVVPPERLVFSARAFEDDAGNALLEDVTTVTFEALNGKTAMRLHAVVLKETAEGAEAAEGMEEGWNQSLDRLVELLAKA
jgi:uncharacterized protein YndB with AHSA1/START domain